MQKLVLVKRLQGGISSRKQLYVEVLDFDVYGSRCEEMLIQCIADEANSNHTYEFLTIFDPQDAKR